jgi:UDP-2,4-diacetamido-2,4,6-trideoxy-beta-L-altropyranose hydrolase
LKIAFRVDATQEIGTGHVVRCLTLASQLKKLGTTSLFVIHSSKLEFKARVESQGFGVEIINSGILESNSADIMLKDADKTLIALDNFDPDVVVVDNYKIDHIWENKIGNEYKNLIVIDDLANRKHDCRLLLDQTAIRLPIDYLNLLKINTTLLIGPQFTLLDPSFANYRNSNSETNNKFIQIFMGFGSIDTYNLIPKMLNYAQKSELLKNAKFVIAISSLAPQINQLKDLIKDLNLPVELHIDPPDLPKLMASSDLAISAGGLMSLELACLGVSSLILPFSDIQRSVANFLALEVNFVILDRWKENLELELNCALEYLLRNKSPFHIKKRHPTIDGLGTNRVIEHIIKYD